MRLILEPRAAPPVWAKWAAPFAALAVTGLIGAIIFALLGKPPIESLRVMFLDPLLDPLSLEDVVVKSAPLVLIAVGLVFAYRSNNWNIGAEGQFVIGGLIAGGLAVAAAGGGASGPWLIVAMLAGGALGGIAWGAIPALLKIRFGASEILTSLMLVYVAEKILDYLVRGPWRDPKGFNFPQTISFEGWARLPTLGDGRFHIGIVLTLAIALFAAFVLARTLYGFSIRTFGESPRAARFAGFSPAKVSLSAFAISGGLAGLAGAIEVAGPIGQLQPSISPGYGFTAIIVAFLGRLSPIGCIFAGLALAVSFIGGEQAQILLNIPLDLTKVLQAVLLFAILGADALTRFRPRLIRSAGAAV